MPQSRGGLAAWRSIGWACWTVSLILSCTVCLTDAHGGSLPAQAVLQLSPTAPVSLADHLQFLPDPDGHLSLAELLSKREEASFRPVKGFLNRGYTREWSWLRASVCRGKGLSHDWMLSLGPALLDHVTVYVQVGEDPTAASSYQEYVLGDHHPIAQRPVRDANFVVPLILPEDQPRLVYIHLQTTSAHTLKGWVYSPADFIYWSQIESLLTGAFLGIALLVALVNAIFAIRLRDILYGYYACYVLALFVCYFAVEGLLPLVWPAGAHLVSDYLGGGGLALSLGSFALFATRLFDTRRQHRFAHRYFQLTLLLGIGACLAIPLNRYVDVAPVLVGNGLIFVLCLVWLGVKLYRQRVPAGGLFLLAFMVSNLGAVFVLLKLVGVMPVNWLTTYSQELGAVLSMILMTLALTARVHAAEEKALAASREAEQRAVEIAREMTAELVEKQKELEDALETERLLHESQTRFVEIISHEYRTPLAIIRTNLDILEMKMCSGACPNVSNIAKMKRAVARLVEVLAVSLGRERSPRERLQMRRESFDLPSFVAGVTDEIRGLWGDRQLLFEAECEALPVTGDPALLKTALLNLVENALKYSGQQEPVGITVGTEQGEAVVTVADRGCGIAAAELERVFEKHYRGAGSVGTRGAGLGLHLVRDIVEQHGGSIKLVSSVPGGTVAAVRLPVVQERRGDEREN